MKKMGLGRFSNKFVLTVLLFFLTAVLLPSSSFESKVQAASSPRYGGAYYNYGEALQKAILFYKANRLGDLPDDYILPYRADAAMTDGQDVGLDLTGGWADAGDGIKFTHPMSYAAGQLGWAVYEYRQAFEKAGLLDDILDEINGLRTFSLKLIRSQMYCIICAATMIPTTRYGFPRTFGLCDGQKVLVLNPSTPGSDVAGQTAACLAIASIYLSRQIPNMPKPV